MERIRRAKGSRTCFLNNLKTIAPRFKSIKVSAHIGLHARLVPSYALSKALKKNYAGGGPSLGVLRPPLAQIQCKSLINRNLSSQATLDGHCFHGEVVSRCPPTFLTKFPGHVHACKHTRKPLEVSEACSQANPPLSSQAFFSPWLAGPQDLRY